MNSLAGDVALLAIVLPLLFLPSVVAFWRRHPRRWWILAVNFFLGPIGIGWLGAWLMMYRVPLFSDTGLQPATSSARPCPHCNRFYDPADYRRDAVDARCSYCGKAISLA